jgi:hypothetical protein
MWRVTLFAVSALIGLAIVTTLRLAVTNVAIKFELAANKDIQKHLIYKSLTETGGLVVTKQIKIQMNCSELF